MPSSFISKISFCIYFLPLALISGPLISELIINFVWVNILYLIIKNKNYKYINNIYFKIFLIFWIYILVRSIFTTENSEEIIKKFAYIRLGLFSISIWFLIDNNKNFLNHFYKFLSFSVAILLFDGYYQYFFSTNIIGFEIVDSRISSFFGDEKILGTYLSRIVILLISLIILLETKYSKFEIFIYLFLTDILIFLSGDRAPFFLFNLSSIGIILLCSNKIFRNLRIITFVASIMVILIISIIDSGIRERVILKTLSELGLSKTDPTYTIDTDRNFYLFSPQHENYYTVSYRMFKKNPIFGMGSDSFTVYCKKKEFLVDQHSCSTHPHNIYMQLISEFGLIGFIIIFALFIFINLIFLKHLYLKIFKKEIKFTDFQICLLIYLYICLWPLIPTGNFFNNWISILYYLPVGFILYSLNNKKIV